MSNEHMIVFLHRNDQDWHTGEKVAPTWQPVENLCPFDNWEEALEQVASGQGEHACTLVVNGPVCKVVQNKDGFAAALVDVLGLARKMATDNWPG